VVINNTGQQEARNIKLRVLLSPDAIPDAADIKLREIKIPKLAAGSQLMKHVSVRTRPNVAAPGDYLILVLDPDGRVAESNESDNTTAVYLP
jgi:uncharacterized membrane protein